MPSNFKLLIPLKFCVLALLLVLVSCGTDSESSDSALANPCELFPDNAGVKIINGTECPVLGEIPVARLALFDDEDNRSICTATIIGAHYALTAAHCLNELVFRAELQLGSESVVVSDIIPHPSYNARFVEGRLLNDVALVKTDSKMSFPVAKLSFESQDSEKNYIHVFGYGSNRIDGVAPGTISPLRGVSLQVDAISSDFIFSRFESLTDGNVCFGDSGGPVFVKQSDRTILVGITSTGTNSNCAVGDIAAFTRLSGPGIEEFVRQGVGL